MTISRGGTVCSQVHRQAHASLSVVREAARAPAPEAATSLDQLAWCSGADGIPTDYDISWYERTDLRQVVSSEAGWIDLIHDDDRGQARALWRQSLLTGEPFRTQCRFRHRSGCFRWVVGHAQCATVNDAGAKHWYGTFTDIQDIKEEAELHRIKSDELTHRLKNVLTVMSSLVRMSVYEFPEAKHYSDLLQNRIAALACTYPHVRCEDFGIPKQQATVQSLIKRLTEGYEGLCKSRFLVRGPDTLIGPTAAFALALILQELLTNAAKYGALSTQNGQVKISCLQDDDCFHLVWMESNGGEPIVLPQHYGFGTKLIDRAQKIIAADCKLDWRPDGLCFSLDVHPSQLEK